MAPEKPKSAAAPGARDYDVALFELLRARRKALADAANVPAYVIFSDRALAEMATYFPQSEQSLVQIHGVGKAKLDRYAGDFLPLIRRYCEENGLDEKPVGSARRTRRTGLGNRTQEVVSLFNAGQSVPDIAETFGVRQTTVLNHLWKANLAGRDLSDGNLLSLSQLNPAEQQRVVQAFDEHGLDYLRPVYDALGESVSYDELHLIRLHLAITGDQET